MNYKTPKYWLMLALTFVIIFLFNYVGNPSEDRLQTALMVGAGGAAGLAIGLFLYGKKGGGDGQDFD